MGNVRLGELGLPVHHHHRRVPDLLRHRCRGRPAGSDGDSPLCHGAVASPILGAYADLVGAKKRMLALGMGVGVTATAAMFLIREGDWRLAEWLFVVANIGVSASFVFYDSLHHAEDEAPDDGQRRGGGHVQPPRQAWAPVQ